ncbi:restriction endonuclease subunit S [Enterobacter hormaechei]|uniref:restriction endonuclease subunit S n=1 Tax=Enterobacter hormaechei TaxID=158836 RepID=UPI002093C1D2|nr:restriction endonuclease subunit S [Enterobacter hormaechei]MCO5983700.1 restriction endonuclease subunit S [Enterobacter hormaechei]
MMDNVLKMQVNKAVPAGYKLTEMGVIPEDWDVYTFNDLIESCSSGATPYRGNKSFYTGNNKWITSGELNYCVINDTLEKISDEAVKRSNLKIHPAGTFLMAITGMEAAGTRGACGIVGLPAATNQSCMAIYPNEKLLSAYLYHWYVYNGEALAFKYCQGTKQLSYTAGLLRTIPIYIPGIIKEQIRIANVLSDTDALITKLEQLIAKKQTIKSATMQQLMTGRTRLPQFAKHSNSTLKGYKSSELGLIPEDWDVYTFNDLIESCSSGATPYRGNKSFYTGNNKWITSGELNYCVINDTLEKISDEAVKRSNLKIHPAGTFLMAITGMEAAGTRGACGIVGLPAATNQSCMAIYPNEKLLSAYLYHWYVYNGEALAFKYCQGTKQLSYTAGLLRTIPLYIPNMVEEQTAIATILSDMDAELTALERKLAKFRDIKQGMMQQLLTGRIRLPLEQQP